MRDYVQCECPAGYDGAAIRARLAQVLDPELDEAILDLGFVRGLRLRSGYAAVALRLPRPGGARYPTASGERGCRLFRV
jgi:hypothetical protein